MQRAFIHHVYCKRIYRGAGGKEEGWGRQGKESRDQGAGRRAGGGRGRGPGTRGQGGGLGEAGEGVPGPGGREEGWGRQGKESRDQGAGRRAGGGRENLFFLLLTFSEKSCVNFLNSNNNFNSNKTTLKLILKFTFFNLFQPYVAYGMAIN